VADDPSVQVLEAVKRELLRTLDRRYLGPKKFIYCYLPEDGGCPAREFLDSLSNEAQASYATSFERRSAGHQIRGDKHRVWTEKGCEGLHEFKDNQSKTRVVHITDVGQTDVLLFGFGGKKEDKVDLAHVNRAQRLRDEYRRRRAVIEARVLASVKRRLL
jgi:hypothetical protein